MKFYETLNSYMEDILKTRGIFLEVRMIEDELFLEKIGFIQTNSSSQIEFEKDTLREILGFDYILLKRMKSKIEGGLKPKSSFNYESKTKCLLYAVWVDKDKNIIIPTTVRMQMLDKGITFTLSP